MYVLYAGEMYISKKMVHFALCINVKALDAKSEHLVYNMKHWINCSDIDKKGSWNLGNLCAVLLTCSNVSS